MTQKRGHRWWAFISPNHKAVGRSITYALCWDEPEAWYGLAKIFVARLNPLERANLAYASLRGLSKEDRMIVYKSVENLKEIQGAPIAPWTEEIIEDADYWSRSASQEELRAYFTAIINQMSPDDKKIAARHLTG